jgi:hypothetical protein
MPGLARGEMFVHIAPNLQFDGRRLTLVDVAPSTIWRSGADAELGYLPTGAFLDRWAERDRVLGPGSGCMRGSLSLLDPDASVVGSAVLELSRPRMSASGLTYDAQVVDGMVPGASGACVLFLEWEQSAAPGAEARSEARSEEPVDSRRQMP